MANTGIFRLGHEAWQRANVIAAASFLREVIAREPDNARAKALYEGLLDVVEPTRRAQRLQRELASATKKQERRSTERRAGQERRQTDLRIPPELDRRSGIDRRLRDRRKV